MKQKYEKFKKIIDSELPENTFRLLLCTEKGAVVCNRFWTKKPSYVFNSEVAEEINTIVRNEINKDAYGETMYNCILTIGETGNFYEYTIPILNRHVKVLYRINIKEILPTIANKLGCKSPKKKIKKEE